MCFSPGGEGGTSRSTVSVSICPHWNEVDFEIDLVRSKLPFSTEFASEAKHERVKHTCKLSLSLFLVYFHRLLHLFLSFIPTDISQPRSSRRRTAQHAVNDNAVLSFANFLKIEKKKERSLISDYNNFLKNFQKRALRARV